MKWLVRMWHRHSPWSWARPEDCTPEELDYARRYFQAIHRSVKEGDSGTAD